MTQTENIDTARLVVGKPKFWYAGRFFEVGDSFNSVEAEANAKGIQLVGTELNNLLEHGFLIDQDDLERAQNPEAFAARKKADGAEAEIAQLRSELETAKQAQDELGSARATAQNAQAELDRLREELIKVQAEKANAPVAETEPLLALFKDGEGHVPTLPDVVSVVKAQQSELTTLRALHAVAEGTELPGNFIGRGKLAPFGLTTYESLRGKTPEQLDAIEGLTLDQAKQIAEKVAAHFEKPTE